MDDAERLTNLRAAYDAALNDLDSLAAKAGPARDKARSAPVNSIDEFRSALAALATDARTIGSGEWIASSAARAIEEDDYDSGKKQRHEPHIPLE